MSGTQESQHTSVSSSQSTSLATISGPPSIASADIRSFLEISPDGLVIVNPAGTIVLVNGQQEDAGSTFFLRLPAVSDAAPPAQQPRRERRKKLPA